MIYALIGCLIIIGFLGFKLFLKQKLDKSELENLKKEINQNREIEQELNNKLLDLQIRCNDARNERILEESRVEDLKRTADEALQLYHDTIDVRMSEINDSMEEQRQKRQEDLDKQFEESKQKLDLKVERYKDDCEKLIGQITDMTKRSKEENFTMIQQYHDEIEACKQQYESLLEPLRQYEKDRQARLFYTIQLPEEYQEDIEFLLTTVAAKVQHPDIISKLVWSEYVKPNLDETFKRIDIHAEPGIYKLTSLETGKCYVGKSTNVKTRIADHFKSVVGIKSIADQAVHHVILKEGFWNWTIEIITYCDKDKLSELEKYYIEFFKAQEFGYNKNGGG